jgi:cyclophilin family peptidyl-prolyl cis-trans isomerase
MVFRNSIALGVILVAALPAAAQDVVRFETSIGEFDMVLNPTNNPRLRAHAANMRSYVEDNRYNGSWINRADENFVLQMGAFYSHTKRPPPTIASTRPLATFAPVPGEPAETIPGLSNTIGTVALALPGGAGGTDQDAGTSSFFVNLTSNAFLDEDFTVFAAIPDMTVVNQIMALMQVDKTTDSAFGAGAGNLAFADIPLQENGFQVFINRAFMLNDPLAIARARAGVESIMAASVEAAGGQSISIPLGASAVAMPEPASLVAFATGLMAMWVASLRRAMPRNTLR